MTKRLLPTRWQAEGADGRPLAGAALYTYATGTSTPKATFTDAGLTIPAANPLVADAAGRFPQVFLGPGDYRMELRDAAGAVVTTDDPVDGNDGSFADGTALLPSITFAADPNTGFYRPGSDTIGFVTNGAERMRITNTGAVGVGTTAPLAFFHVNGNLMLGGAVTGQTAIIGGTSGAASAFLEAVDPTNTATKRDLSLQGFGGTISSLAAYNATTASAANQVVLATGQFARSTSSLRYKQDVRSMAPAACLTRLMTWRPVTFEEKGRAGPRYAGFIAEEMAAAGAEEYVVRDTQGRPDALQYPHMIAEAVGAIQELQRRLAALEAVP